MLNLPILAFQHTPREGLFGPVPDWAPDFFRTEILQTSLWNLVLAFLAILAGVVVSQLIVAFVNWRLRKTDEKGEGGVDPKTVRAISRPLFWLAMQGGIWLAVEIIGLPEEIEKFCERALLALAAAIVTWAAMGLIDLFAAYLSRLTSRTESKLDDQLVPLVRKALKIFVVVVAAVLVLQNMGYNVTGLVAGLSIFGLALGLAAQETLGHFFGGIILFVERPFSVGDWITIDGGLEGTVEEVGFRSTKIRTFAKTLITVPNGKVAHAAIENFSRMPIRRISMTLGISYSPSGEQVRAALDEIRALIRNDERIDQTFWMVYLKDLQDSSLGVMLYLFTKTTVWADYLAIREDLLLKIKDLLSARGIEIPFPARTVYLRQDEKPVPTPLEELRKGTS